MSSTKKRLTAACADCGIDTLEPGPNFYAVHDHVWREAWPTTGQFLVVDTPPVGAGGQFDFGFPRYAKRHEFLCMHCLELRLGRGLEAGDFADAPISDEIKEWKGKGGA